MFYRIWTAICSIQDPLLRITFSLLDLTTEQNQKIAALLPEYFAQDKTAETGPIPYSAIKAAQEKDGDEQVWLGWYVADLGIPVTYCVASINSDTGPSFSDVVTGLRSEYLVIGDDAWDSICNAEGSPTLVDCDYIYEATYQGKQILVISLGDVLAIFPRESVDMDA